MDKRPMEICIISDLHLGTFGCQAKEVLNYLKSIKPKTLILNGDIIDIWQFNKRYFPASHMAVIKQIFSMASKDTKVIYITGNHDEALRKYADFEMGNIQLTDKIVFEINGEKNWVFHGDVFDRTTKGGAKIIAKLGGYGYDLLILINSLVNWSLKLLGKEKMSLSKSVKNGVKKAVSWINNFEQTAAELAIENNYQYVICGHIHQPQHRVVTTDKGTVTYLNSGDWIENLTSLEYYDNAWTLYHYDPKQFEEEKGSKKNKIINLREELSVMTKEVAFQVSM
ncbi:MAG: UDP-2,3-diacylglucosamine diphosphatase [Chitinophagaceae bacterium]|nr:UDP-2,3-diacylglucosamine diphosphatase [Chitinophagaceae bacterium]